MLKFIAKLISACFTLALLIFAALLVIGNPQMISVSIWPFSFSFALPIWLLAMLCFGAGLMIGGVVMLVPIARHQLRIRKLKKENLKLKQDNLNLPKGSDEDKI